MKPRWYLILFALGLAVAFAAAAFETVPGYMDADYYFMGGIQIASGAGWQEPFLWNYLDQPAGLPHPAFTYWMPLSSLLAALGMMIGGQLTFDWAQLPFVLLTATLSPLTAFVTSQISPDPRNIRLAGLLALFPGFYLSQLVTTETFVIAMVLGGLFLLTVGLVVNGRLRSEFSWLIFGLIAGLFHLTRADGLLWLPAALIAAGWASWRSLRARWSWLHGFLAIVTVTAVYAAVMLPWFARNLVEFGSLMSPGGIRTLWLTDYNQTFFYPVTSLTPSAWLSSGWLNILQVRAWALKMNLQNLLGVQMMVVLLLLVPFAAWRYRRHSIIVFGGLLWLATLLAFTVVFPFAGARGGYLHSSAAFQPFIWTLAALGLDEFVSLGKRKRGWKRKEALAVFGSALVVICAVITIFAFYVRVIGLGENIPAWSSEWRHHRAEDAALDELGIEPDAIIMVNNPPGFTAASGRPSIVVPGGDVDMLLRASRDFGAQYLLLEEGQENLSDLYAHPQAVNGLRYVSTIDGAHIFEVPK